MERVRFELCLGSTLGENDRLRAHQSEQEIALRRDRCSSMRSPSEVHPTPPARGLHGYATPTVTLQLDPAADTVSGWAATHANPTNQHHAAPVPGPSRRHANPAIAVIELGSDLESASWGVRGSKSFFIVSRFILTSRVFFFVGRDAQPLKLRFFLQRHNWWLVAVRRAARGRAAPGCCRPQARPGAVAPR